MAAPLCRCCGKPIPKRTITVQVHDNEDYCKRMNGGNSTHWRYLHTPEPLRSKADCQSRVNETVVSLRYGHIRNGKMDDRAVSLLLGMGRRKLRRPVFLRRAVPGSLRLRHGARRTLHHGLQRRYPRNQGARHRRDLRGSQHP